jgi:phosphate-selective porin OprO/OprP
LLVWSSVWTECWIEVHAQENGETSLTASAAAAATNESSAAQPPAAVPAKFDFRGRLDADALWTAQSPNNEATFGDLGNAAEIRRAWIGIEGRLDWGRYLAEIDLASGQVVIRDMFLGFGDLQEGQEVRAGHYLEPFSFEVNTASFTFPFMEWSVASLFAPARNWGLCLFESRSCDSTTLSLGVFQAGSDPNDFETDPGSNVGLTGRLTTAPLNDEDEKHVVHLGLALSGRFPERGTIIVNQQPQTSLLSLGDVASSPFVPQILIPASYQQLANLQFAAARGSYWTQAEWYGSWIDQLGGDPVFFHGLYVSGGWFVTGEHRPYQKTNGVFGPVKVNRPLYCRHSACDCETGWGAWELTARFAYVDLQDADTPRGPSGQLVGIRLPEFTFGANWYLTDHVRVMGNYSCALPDEPNTGTSVANIFALRVGVWW